MILLNNKNFVFKTKTKRMVGIVRKISGDKTVSVVCFKNYLFRKYQQKKMRTYKYLSHDEKNICRAEEKVLLSFVGRKISKKKNSTVIGKFLCFTSSDNFKKYKKDQLIIVKRSVFLKYFFCR